MGTTLSGGIFSALWPEAEGQLEKHLLPAPEDQPAGKSPPGITAKPSATRGVRPPVDEPDKFARGTGRPPRISSRLFASRGNPGRSPKGTGRSPRMGRDGPRRKGHGSSGSSEVGVRRRALADGLRRGGAARLQWVSAGEDSPAVC